jgi:DNA polymerase-3 subunit alpha
MKGLAANGMSTAKAEELWKLIEPFAAYGFNKAHAASYGRVAYQTAYMKANFPGEFMTAKLTNESGDLEEVARLIAESRRMGFEVLPPDVNESFSDFTLVVEDGQPTKKIRFGLRSRGNAA